MEATRTIRPRRNNRSRKGHSYFMSQSLRHWRLEEDLNNAYRQHALKSSFLRFLIEEFPFVVKSTEVETSRFRDFVGHMVFEQVVPKLGQEDQKMVVGAFVRICEKIQHEIARTVEGKMDGWERKVAT